MSGELIRFDARARTVRCGDRFAHLSPQEARLLEALVEAYPGTLSRDDAISTIERPDRPLHDPDNQACVVVCRVRRKLRDRRIPIRIDAMRSAGYRLRDHVLMDDGRGNFVLVKADLLLVQRLIAYCADQDLARLAMVRFGG